MSTSNNGRVITFAQAVNEALAEEMRRDPTVFIIGEDVAEAGTPFKVLAGLVDEFGPERVIDSPISEAGITGLGVIYSIFNSIWAWIYIYGCCAGRSTAND